MKHLSETQKARNLRHFKHEEKRKLRRRKRGWQRNRGVGYYKRVSLKVPEEFNFGNGLKDTLNFFNSLHETILSEHKLGIIDFRSCNSISAGVGLLDLWTDGIDYPDREQIVLKCGDPKCRPKLD